MQTQPSQTEEAKATSAEIKASHSVAGCLSALLSVSTFVLMIFLLFTFGSGLNEPNADPGVVNFFSGITAIYSISISFICMPIFLILGIIGLFQRNKKRIFAIIGVSISGLFVLIIAIGMIMGSIQSQ